MARKVGLRPSYNQDAAFFMRIKDAIWHPEAGLDPQWREEASRKLTELAGMFMNVKRKAGSERKGA